MSTEGLVDVVARWLHIVSIVAWAGGSLFVLTALGPAVRGAGGSGRWILEGALLRFRQLVTAATILVLLSGLAMLGVRLSFAGWGRLGATYHAVFGVKVLLALALIALAHVSMARVRRWAVEGREGPPPILLPRVSLATTGLVMVLGVWLHWL